MNIAIVNCFDTYEQRVDLLHEVFTNEGHEVKVFTSDYRHFEKIKRNETKKDFIFFELTNIRKIYRIKGLIHIESFPKLYLGTLKNRTRELTCCGF